MVTLRSLFAILISTELVHTRQKFLYSWLRPETYTRLFLSLLLLILAVSGLRYYLLLEAEVADARQRSQTELRQLTRYLIPGLSALSAQEDRAGIQQLLEQEVSANPAIRQLRWQNQMATQPEPADAIGVPAWFAQLIDLRAEVATHQLRLADGTSAVFSLQTTPAMALETIWRKLLTQLKISAAIMLTIFFLLSRILRSNSKNLQRLALATDSFKRGEHSVRMPVSGNAETQALAVTFNNMAQEVQTLLLSLGHSRHEHSEQAHFTWQLLSALPIPIFFKDRQGLCLGVNPAWEQMFGVAAADMLGQPMQEFLAYIAPAGLRETMPEAGKQVQEIRLPVAAGKILDAIYYRASFTHLDGTPAGNIGALVDISERNQAQAALVAEKEQVETTLASIGDAVISTDIAGRILTLNKVAQQLTGWCREQAQGQSLAQVFTLADASGSLAMAEFVQHIGSHDQALQASNQILFSHAGQPLAIDYTAAAIRQRDGGVSGCVLVFRDVSEKRHLMQQISWQAGHDVLTGLENRSSLAERLQQAIARAQAKQQWLAVCLLDLDHFQAVNDKHGQLLADKLLQQVAHRLETWIGAGNHVARLGGDEFVVLLQAQTDTASVERRLALLLAELSQAYEVEQLPVKLSASIGVAIYTGDDANPDTLLRCADQAMYQAKQSGRNQFHLFDTQQDQQVRTHHNQRARIRQGLMQGEFRLYFQPKVNMPQAKVIGMEALLRWQHPEQGIVGPLHFLPLVEHTDLIIDIGEWVLQQALEQLRSWTANGQYWGVSVNIAARHFQRSDFLARLSSILASYPEVAPEWLEIEILESAAIQDIQYVREVMLGCQQLGVRFALDDFGTGYSSLSYLKRLPANTLKIDQSFVRDMLVDQEDLALIRAIIGLAKAFKLEVIAEGVETAEQGVALMQLGCDQAQGYGIARPMPADTVSAWARSYAPPPVWLRPFQEPLSASSRIFYNALHDDAQTPL